MANSIFRSFLHDRTQAGRLLAYRLMGYANRGDVVVCALPRGGVPVGAEIAHALKVPLTVFLVRKLGVPGREELAMGALTSGGMKLVNRATTGMLHISEDVIEAVANRANEDLSRRERLYCRGRCAPDLKG